MMPRIDPATSKIEITDRARISQSLPLTVSRLSILFIQSVGSRQLSFATLKGDQLTSYLLLHRTQQPYRRYHDAPPPSPAFLAAGEADNTANSLIVLLKIRRNHMTSKELCFVLTVSIRCEFFSKSCA
jgi:hypothetical protein